MIWHCSQLKIEKQVLKMKLILHVCSLVNFLHKSTFNLISKDFCRFLVNQRKLDLFGFWDCLNSTHFLVHVPRYCVFTNQKVVSCNYWESGKLSDTITVKHQLAKFNVHCCKTLTEPCLQPNELHSHIPHTKSNISIYLFVHYNEISQKWSDKTRDRVKSR